MPMTVSTSAIRTQLAADIVIAWSVFAVFFHSAKTPLSGDKLPRAFVIVSDVEPARERGQAGFGQSELAFLFQITGQFPTPAPGTDTFQDLKEDKADALLALLTASAAYAGGRRDVRRVAYAENEPENQEPYFEVHIDFEVRTARTA